MQICAIIPVYNNVATIGQIIEDVLEIVADVIVVDDGSTDGTSEILAQISSAVTIIGYDKNRGKGYALLQGFLSARKNGFTHAITIDADGQHFASDIPVFLSEIKNNPNGIIVGSRNLTEKNMPQQNTFANKFSNFWYKLQTGINIPDTQSGFRLYALSAVRTAWPITSRYEAELEFLVFAAWAGKRISSVPIHVYYPSPEKRVSHFRPVYDFARISLLNTLLCVLALVYGYPVKLMRSIKRKWK